jgi:amino-acid N-acetyltransferase
MPSALPGITTLLAAAGLPADDLWPTNLGGFEVAIDDRDRIVGVAGSEVLDGSALLRSVAVAPDWRGKGVGETLVVRRESAARAAGAAAIYLLTTSAGDYFRRLGYADIARDAVPPAVATHAQFRSLCPASAVCLAKRI